MDNQPTAIDSGHELLLGIDVGGTSVKAGLFTTEGKLLGEASVPTPALITEEAYAVVTTCLDELVQQHGDGNNVIGIGLDIPGPIGEDGLPGFIPNAQIDLLGLEAAIMRSYPHAILAALNDANAAALGELWRGAAQGERSVVFVTLGTGVGGGIVCDGKLVAGKNGCAGEIGHLTVNPHESRVCGCGRKGCLEQYASATGVVYSYKAACARLGKNPCSLTGPSDSRSVFEAFEAGDKAAAEAIRIMCSSLAFALSCVAATVNPGAFVIGGGMGEAFDIFAEELIACYREQCLSPVTETRFERASLGNKAGMYGSAYQALMLARS